MPQPWSLTVAVDDPVGRACDRIDADDPAIAAFLPEPGRRSRLQGSTDGPLAGIPVGVKDIIRVDGLPTRAGSALPADVFAGPQATVVDRLQAAGAVVAGKTVTAEFAVAAPGPTRNPHNPAHTPGGSSSGSAAAVAAGMVPLALGTQTVGSVIRPAAYCGVVGFKPSFGRIPIDGVIPNAASLDTVGIFAADVASVLLAAPVLCDEWTPVASTSQPVLGIPTGPYLDHASVSALKAFHDQIGALEEAGFSVRQVPAMADFVDIASVLFIVNRYELAQSHAEWFPRFGSLYREQTATAIRQGLAIDRADYEKAVRGRAEFRARLLDEMTVDLWITPAATGPAPKGLASTGDSVMCLPWSYAGMPAISLPAGCVDGLPVGLQVVGRPGDDERVLAWAGDIESAGSG